MHEWMRNSYLRPHSHASPRQSVFPVFPGRSPDEVTFILQNLGWLPSASRIKHRILSRADLAGSGLNLPFWPYLPLHQNMGPDAQLLLTASTSLNMPTCVCLLAFAFIVIFPWNNYTISCKLSCPSRTSSNAITLRSLR